MFIIMVLCVIIFANDMTLVLLMIPKIICVANVFHIISVNSGRLPH